MWTLERYSYQAWNIDSFFRDLSPSAQGEKLVDRVEIVLCVFLWDGLEKGQMSVDGEMPLNHRAQQ